MEREGEIPANDRCGLELWCAYPGDLAAEGAAEACMALLSESERERAGQFRFERHGREYMATHALARTVLSHLAPIAPKDWRFGQNEYGKPALEPDCGLRFNLSNSVELVVCLVARGAEVGVDLEACARAVEIAGLADEVFSAQEQAQLEALGEAEKLQRALSLWTLKESYIKARGMGLSLPLKKFSFLFGGSEGIHLEMEPELNDSPERWRFCLLDHAEHRIALMVERQAPDQAADELEIWEARPPQGTATLLAGGNENWFPRR